MAYWLQVGECLHCGTEPNADLCIVSSAGLSVWYTRKRKITRYWVGERGFSITVFIRVTLVSLIVLPKIGEDPQECFPRFASEYRSLDLRVVFQLVGQETTHTMCCEQRA